MNTSSESVNIKGKQVDELVDRVKKSKTLMIVSVKGLPSKQFQDIKKSVREDASVQIAKKNIVMRALEKYEKDSIKPLEEFVKSDFAYVISDKEGYELAALLGRKKTPVFAKAGQISPTEIEVKAGPTDLVPGPAISELGALGIKIAVVDGKISIKAPKVIVREGQEINEATASLLQKLNIQPFNVGLEPLVIYDVESEKIYTNIEIDSEEAAKELSSGAGKALMMARKIAYYCKETIGYLLAKSNLNGEALGKLQSVEEVKTEDASTESSQNDNAEESKDDEVSEEKVEEVKEETKSEEKPDEEKKDEEKKEDNVQLNNPEENA